MLTIEDIRNDKHKSGFNHVRYAVDKRNGRTNPSPYQAHSNDGGGRAKGSWRGPRRITAEWAAQDYCDYINDNKLATPTSLNKAGHGSNRDSLERDEELEAALGVLRDHKAQKAGRQGYVYLIGVEGDTTGVKLGYSVKPEARVGELQTGNPRKLKLLGYFPATTADEKAIHSRYIQYNLIGEWFMPTPEMLAEFDVVTSL